MRSIYACFSNRTSKQCQPGAQLAVDLLDRDQLALRVEFVRPLRNLDARDRDPFADIVLDRLEIVGDYGARDPIGLSFVAVLETNSLREERRPITTAAKRCIFVTPPPPRRVGPKTVSNRSCGFHSCASRTLHSLSKSDDRPAIPILDELRVRRKVHARKPIPIALHVQARGRTTARRNALPHCTPTRGGTSRPRTAARRRRRESARFAAIPTGRRLAPRPPRATARCLFRTTCSPKRRYSEPTAKCSGANEGIGWKATGAPS